MGVSTLALSREDVVDVVVQSDVSRAAWDSYVQSCPDATVYHLSGWADIMRDVFGHRTEYLSAVDRGRVVGVLPLVFFKSPLFGRFATSMPFVNYGGVVADSAEASQALLTAAIDASRDAGCDYLELRHTNRTFAHLDVKTHKVAMVLPLQVSAEQQWRVLDRKLRNQVRKAHKSDLTSRIGGVELIPEFCDVLAENMRDLGTPSHSCRFFEQILRTFPDRTRLFAVELEGKPIAASMVIWNGDRIEVPWASSLRRYNPLCGNVLLYWELLKYAIGRGMNSFDFGRSTPHEGTYQFKKQWGARPRALHWEYWLANGVSLPDRSPANPRFAPAIAMWQRLPVRMTRALGPRIIRNIP